jgi:hypothetical protein
VVPQPNDGLSTTFERRYPDHSKIPSPCEPIFGERRRLIVVISFYRRIEHVVLTLMSIPTFAE